MVGIRFGDLSPAELSKELRRGRGTFLEKRRRLAVLQLVASGALGVVSLYQLGVIKRVPEPSFPGLDADTVDAADEAYAILGMPDGPLGIVSYAVTLALVAMGGAERARSQPWIPLALAGKVAFDAAVGAKLTVEQWTKHRAFCSWCLASSFASFASVPAVVPEARAAWGALRRG